VWWLEGDEKVGGTHTGSDATRLVWMKTCRMNPANKVEYGAPTMAPSTAALPLYDTKTPLVMEHDTFAASE
jgi:hypothetical protein